MKVIDDYCSRQSLENKIIANAALCIAAILLVACIGLQMLSSAYNAQYYESVAGNLTVSAQLLSGSMDFLEDLSATIFSSESIQNSLDSVRQTEDQLRLANLYRDLNSTLVSYYETYKSSGVICFSLYSAAFTNTTNPYAIRQVDPDIIQQAVDRAQEGEGRIVWSVDTEHQIAILSRNIRKISGLDLSSLGNLLIFIDLDQLVNIASQTFSQYADDAYLIAENDELLYYSDALSMEDAYYYMEHSANPYRILHYKGDDYFTIKSVIPGYDWSIVGLTPFSRIAQSIRTARTIIVLAFVCAFFVTVAFSRNTTRFILRDFRNLTKKMEKFDLSDLTSYQSDPYYAGRTDEVSRLHQAFDAMALKIQDLIQKNYVSQILKQEAQLRTLETQINPHFLYNTLETINWRAKALNDYQISAIVEALGSLLRSTLSNKKSLVTLAYEKSVAESYMTIQKIRFADRLEFQLSCDETLNDFLVPAFSLQPLLENAIRYGMEECLDTCNIYISVTSNENNLFIRVANEGSYFEDGLLEKLQSGERSAHGFGIGLTNIDKRIHILFGDEYGLSLYNKDEMAVVMLTLPRRKEDDFCAEADYS